MTQADAIGAAHAAAGAAVAGDACAGDVGSWKLVRLLGQGQFTRVHSARPVKGDDRTEPYAIKILQSCHEENPEAVRCLRREALVGRAVSHANLVSILAAQLLTPPYFVVMPRLVGRRLDDLISRQPLSTTMALCVVRQVAQALGSLHAAGWAHADVKPSNVIVSPSGHATLFDFGFAWRRDEASSMPRVLRGSPAYLAPEAFVSTSASDIRSDLYSLGVVLFELLAGRRPFPENDAAALARLHLSAAPPDLRRLAPHVPGEVARLVEVLLAKQPLRRPQTPRELIDRLVSLEIMTFAERQPLVPSFVKQVADLPRLAPHGRLATCPTG
jgi:serine/threonine-protein kinase